MGCYGDRENRDINGTLTNGHYTPEICNNECTAGGYLYFGLQASDWCLCGNSYGKYGISTNCNLGCRPDSSKICGGLWANSVYKTSFVPDGM